MTPNFFAYVAFFGFPLLGIALFRRLPLANALIWTFLAGHLLLPTGLVIDLPKLPPLDKSSITSVTALLCVWISLRKQRGKRALQVGGQFFPEAQAQQSMPRTDAQRWTMFDLMLVAIFIGAFFTALSNDDPLVYGPRIVKGLSPYDALSAAVDSAIMLIPFMLARKHLATEQARVSIIKALAIAGLLYSFPVLWEIRMSPQLQVNVYGFFPSDWVQSRRLNGFRAIVFLGHGLPVALLLCSSALCALLMSERSECKNPKRWKALCCWLFAVLVLQKSLGALLIFVAFAFAVFLGRSFGRRAICLLVAFVVIFYPSLRAASMIPIDQISRLASMYSVQRSVSFNVRVENEEALLAKVQQRPLLGWGSWGRNRIYSTESGRDLSLTDGYWIIILGQGGWLRFLCIFLLLTLPTVMLLRGSFIVDGRASVTALCVVLSANVLDLMPNSTVSMITWLMAGTVLGALEYSRSKQAISRLHGYPKKTVSVV